MARRSRVRCQSGDLPWLKFGLLGGNEHLVIGAQASMLFRFAGYNPVRGIEFVQHPLSLHYPCVRFRLVTKVGNKAAFSLRAGHLDAE